MDKNNKKLNFFQRIYLYLCNEQEEAINNPPNTGMFIGGTATRITSTGEYLTRRYPKLAGDKKIYNIIALIFIVPFILALIGFAIMFIFHIN